MTQEELNKRLFIAIEAGDLNHVKEAIDDGAGVNAIESENTKYTPLHVAVVKEGKQEIVKLLLERGADIESKDQYGQTPLHWAAIKNDLEVLKVLVKKNANLNAKNEFGNSALHLAVDHKSDHALQILIEEKANINITNDGNETPLHNAAFDGKIDIVKILLANGANTEVKDELGNDFIHYALINGDIELVQWFFEEHRKSKDWTSDVVNEHLSINEDADNNKRTVEIAERLIKICNNPESSSKNLIALLQQFYLQSPNSLGENDPNRNDFFKQRSKLQLLLDSKNETQVLLSPPPTHIYIPKTSTHITKP